MEAPIPQSVSEKDFVTQSILFLASILLPRYDRDIILGDIQTLLLRCNSRRESAWSVGEMIAGVIRARMQGTFDAWLVVGETLSLYLALYITDVHAPLLPFAALLVLLTVLWRVRDAYAYVAEGTATEMFLDAVFGLGTVLAVESFFTSEAPRLALPISKIYISAFAVLWISYMRMLSRREHSPDPEMHKIEQKRTAVWHLNLLWILACLPLGYISVIGVPGSHERDRLLGGLLPWAFLAVMRLKKRVHTSVWQKPILSIKQPGVPELEHELGILWVRDKVSKFRSDLLAEIAYFIVLGFPLFQAPWWWVSRNPAAAGVDWLQVGANLLALAALIVVWNHIKKMNEQLAALIRREIEKRKAAASA